MVKKEIISPKGAPAEQREKRNLLQSCKRALHPFRKKMALQMMRRDGTNSRKRVDQKTLRYATEEGASAWSSGEKQKRRSTGVWKEKDQHFP